MTVLGKILVIVHFLFTLVTVYLIVMVYERRTNWKAGYDKVVTELTVARANADVYREDAEKAKNTADTRVSQMQLELNRAKDEQRQLQSEVEKEKKDLATEQANARAANLKFTAGTSELERRRQEYDQIQAQLGVQGKKIFELEKLINDSRNQKVAAEIGYRSAQARNVDLLKEVERLTKELDATRSRISGTSVTGGNKNTNPPPQDVKGEILKVDASSGLVVLSIGTDAGLSVNNTLEVWRYEPTSDYVGKIQIVDARADRAVGKPVYGLRPGRIKVGDMVGNRIH